MNYTELKTFTLRQIVDESLPIPYGGIRFCVSPTVPALDPEDRPPLSEYCFTLITSKQLLQNSVIVKQRFQGCAFILSV